MFTVRFIERRSDVPEGVLAYDSWRSDPMDGDRVFLNPRDYSHSYIFTILAKISNFKNITLYCQTKDGKPNTTVLLTAQTAYLNGELIKSREPIKEKTVKTADIEMRIPEEQLQRLEAMVARIEKSTGNKTWKQKILGFLFGRVAIISMVAAYFYLGGSSNPAEVVSFDQANGVISIQENGSIVNLLLKNDTLFNGSDKVGGGFYDVIRNSILLDQQVVGLKDDSSWFF